MQEEQFYVINFSGTLSPKKKTKNVTDQDAIFSKYLAAEPFLSLERLKKSTDPISRLRVQPNDSFFRTIQPRNYMQLQKNNKNKGTKTLAAKSG